jgi:hypothetical protein
MNEELLEERVFLSVRSERRLGGDLSAKWKFTLISSISFKLAKCFNRRHSEMTSGGFDDYRKYKLAITNGKVDGFDNRANEQNKFSVTKSPF